MDATTLSLLEACLKALGAAVGLLGGVIAWINQRGSATSKSDKSAVVAIVDRSVLKEEEKLLLKKTFESTGRRGLIAILLGVVSLILLILLVLQFISVNPDKALARADGKVFRDLHNGEHFSYGRVFPTRSDLESKTNLPRTLQETKHSFDLMALGAGVVPKYADEFENMLKRGVNFRVLILDPFAGGKGAYDAQFANEALQIAAQRTSALASIDYFEKLLSRKKQDPTTWRGRFDVRVLQRPMPASIWIADAESETPIGHLEFQSAARVESGNISIRVGKGSPSTVSGLSLEFNALWEIGRDLSAIDRTKP